MLKILRRKENLNSSPERWAQNYRYQIYNLSKTFWAESPLTCWSDFLQIKKYCQMNSTSYKELRKFSFIQTTPFSIDPHNFSSNFGSMKFFRKASFASVCKKFFTIQRKMKKNFRCFEVENQENVYCNPRKIRILDDKLA